MLRISNNVVIPDSELELTAIRSQGSGGQNVNKVSSAIHLRFDVTNSSLPESYKHRLLNIQDKRINKDGILIIKAQRFRTQEKNRTDALCRLKELIVQSTQIQKKRIATKPSKASRKRKIDSKIKTSRTKALRRNMFD